MLEEREGSDVHLLIEGHRAAHRRVLEDVDPGVVPLLQDSRRRRLRKAPGCGREVRVGREAPAGGHAARTVRRRVSREVPKE